MDVQPDDPAPGTPAPEGKGDRALRTIGEVADELGVKPHILRYWEEQFPMLRPLKRAGGRRYYRPDDLALLRQIAWLLGERGFTIRGARQHIAAQRRGGGAAEGTADALAQATGQGGSPSIPARSLAMLRAIRADLAHALKAAE